MVAAERSMLIVCISDAAMVFAFGKHSFKCAIATARCLTVTRLGSGPYGRLVPLTLCWEKKMILLYALSNSMNLSICLILTNKFLDDLMLSVGSEQSSQHFS
jgi:hypothetical protein